MSRVLFGFGLAFIVVYVVSVSAASTHVVQQFQAIEGAPAIGVVERMNWLFADLVGMGQQGIFPVLLLAALAIAFGTASIVARFIPSWRFIGFILAGALAMILMHLLVTQAVGTHAIASSRTFTGLMLQGLAGALGGWVFSWLDRKAQVQSSSLPSE